ncbi:uncharacterized protein [Nicotiana sylvestris]|uniref:uncharacterized protein n=1 Tax=Nicotiana sylvestris TaxID=4096 RepID=UPI00388CDBBA
MGITIRCRYLKDDTQVPDPTKGEINPGYGRWFETRSRVDDAPEPDLRRPIKRPHVQTFDDKIKERLAWGEKERGYKATIHALKQSLRNFNLEKDLQAQEAEDEKKSLIFENKNLRAQFQQMKKASEAPVRSWKDQKIIANLMEKMQDYDSILAKTKKALGKAKEKIIQLNEEAESNKERQVMRSEEDMAKFKKEKDRWINSEAQLHAQLEETRRYNREHQHVDIDRERAQARLDQARLRAQLKSKGPIPESMSIPDVDTCVEIEELDVSKMKEEMLKLKQQMAEMYRAWSTGQSPPAYPANPSSTPPPAQTQDHPTTDLSPSFPIYQHYRGTTSHTPQSPPPKPVPYPPPPVMIQKSAGT